MTDNRLDFGSVINTGELGKRVRAYRKQRGLTLAEAAGLANLSVRFFSEFERGKETAEIGKVLKAIRTLGLELSLAPRGKAAQVPSEGQLGD